MYIAQDMGTVILADTWALIGLECEDLRQFSQICMSTRRLSRNRYFTRRWIARWRARAGAEALRALMLTVSFEKTNSDSIRHRLRERPGICIQVARALIHELGADYVLARRMVDGDGAFVDCYRPPYGGPELIVYDAIMTLCVNASGWVSCMVLGSEGSDGRCVVCKMQADTSFTVHCPSTRGLYTSMRNTNANPYYVMLRRMINYVFV